jgi:hypothetical protein
MQLGSELRDQQHRQRHEYDARLELSSKYGQYDYLARYELHRSSGWPHKERRINVKALVHASPGTTLTIEGLAYIVHANSGAAAHGDSQS